MSNCIEPSNLQIIPSYEGEILSLDVCIYQAVNIDNVLVWQEQYFDPNEEINVFTVNGTTSGGRPCIPACAAGYNCCNGYCIFYNDYFNCGSCGNRTGLNQICCQGVLVSTNENCGGCGRNCNGKTCCVANGVSSCIDLTSDDRNCGSCGKSCGAGETCCNGTCKNVGWLDDACENCNGPCTGGQKCCGGHCVDLLTDPTNCGSCYNNILVADSMGNAQDQCCDGEGSFSCCDNKNCGSCGNDCGARSYCKNGYCCSIDSCECLYGVCEEDGKICCAPRNPIFGAAAGCIDPSSDFYNCGSCGNQCVFPEQCCNGVCRDYQIDPLSCGECGNDCTDNQTGVGSLCCGGVCISGLDNGNCGTCGNACPAGTQCCYGTCVDLMTNNTQCGRCNYAGWPPYSTCTNGKQCCGGSCTDLQASLTNCGACGNECFLIINGVITSGKQAWAYDTDENGSYVQLIWVDCVSGSCVQEESPKAYDPGCLDPSNACNSQSNCCGDGEVGTPTCISKTDPSNCGACGNVCDAGKTCCEKDGAYSCVDTQRDNSNCGSCGNQCGTGTNCCNGVCTNYSSDESNCGACGVVCGVDELCCNGVCQNTKTDRNNCGGCGTICPNGMCCDGYCCGSEQSSCCENPNPALPKVCSILSIDESNCGTCGNVCAIGETCCNGQCKDLQTDESNCGTCYNSCLAGYTCCDGVCKELSQDVDNCGTCNYACGPQDVCCNGVCYNYFSDEQHCGSCTNACDAGETCCNGLCKNLQTDEANCGACGVTCLYGTICCSGICKDLLSDEANCGTCGNACGAGQTCCNGACVDLDTDNNNCGGCGQRLQTGQSCCSGIGVNKLTDESNCGSCGTVCGTGTACCNGSCVDILDSTTNCGSCSSSCPAPFKCCDGICKVVLFDSVNCGDCGTICVPPQYCFYGECISDSPPFSPVPMLPNIPIVPPPIIPACEFCCEITGGLNGQNISTLPLTVNLTYDQYFEFQFNTALNITIYESGISSIQNCNVFDSKLFDLSDFLSENTNITPYQFDLSPSCSQGIPYFGLNNFNYNWVCPTQSLTPFIFKVKNNLAEDFSIVIDFNQIDIGPFCCTNILPINEQTGLFPNIIRKSVTVNFIANVANTPAFGSVTSTLDGFTVQITNYDSNFTYSYQSGGNYTVTISNAGLVTVSGMPANTFDTIRISTARTNYDSKYAEIQGSSLSDPTICRIGGLI